MKKQSSSNSKKDGTSTEKIKMFGIILKLAPVKDISKYFNS
jgi:hypothetical protein